MKECSILFSYYFEIFCQQCRIHLKLMSKFALLTGQLDYLVVSELWIKPITIKIQLKVTNKNKNSIANRITLISSGFPLTLRTRDFKLQLHALTSL